MLVAEVPKTGWPQSFKGEHADASFHIKYFWDEECEQINLNGDRIHGHCMVQVKVCGYFGVESHHMVHNTAGTSQNIAPKPTHVAWTASLVGATPGQPSHTPSRPPWGPGHPGHFLVSSDGPQILPFGDPWTSGLQTGSILPPPESPGGPGWGSMRVPGCWMGDLSPLPAPSRIPMDLQLPAKSFLGPIGPLAFRSASQRPWLLMQRPWAGAFRAPLGKLGPRV